MQQSLSDPGAAASTTSAAGIPRHVAIIMDGNRRWARARGLPVVAGHQRGADAARRAAEGCLDAGIQCLTLFAFSSENWKRPHSEVSELMNLLRFYLKREVDKLDREGVCVQFLGERDLIAGDIAQLMEDVESRTVGNRRLRLVIALNYGSRQEIVRAARSLATDVQAGRIGATAIDEERFAHALNPLDLPDPDLLIRTSGELRLSNFLLWQLAYTELVFQTVHWPDFGKEHLFEAIAEYRRRERRSGA